MSTYINSSTTPDRLRKFSAGISNTHMLFANDENNFDIDENDFDETKQHTLILDLYNKSGTTKQITTTTLDDNNDATSISSTKNFNEPQIGL
ncbi:unnamed protein product [Rotaria sordida]|uniref:Uncharacterized protein n=1 Tax=Rotaria sordida TaxID=392033 RepID=A0A814QCP4_9BILA|nr:unnamed protein product [Rotaria sordida]CAF3866185.1 unnamed protein product [Rotaria sordida]